MKKKSIIKKKLTKAEKRVLVCKDVLKHLKSKRIAAKKENTYLEIPDALTFFSIPKNCGLDSIQEVSLQKILKETKKSCTVCALGAMLYSHVIRNNKYNISQYNLNDISNSIDINPYCYTNNGIYDKASPLLKYFSDKDLSNIESRFEHANESLDHIMKDIIKNKGKVNEIK